MRLRRPTDGASWRVPGPASRGWLGVRAGPPRDRRLPGGTVEGGDDSNLVAVAGDATDPDDVAKLAMGHDAIAFADELEEANAVHTYLGTGY